MDLQSRLRESRGAVTSEAALGIAALVMTMVFLTQAVFVSIEYVKLLGLAHHASEIASASGNPISRANEAEVFVRQQDQSLGVIVIPLNNEVAVRIFKIVKTMLPWQPELQATSSSVYVDEVAQ